MHYRAEIAELLVFKEDEPDFTNQADAMEEVSTISSRRPVCVAWATRWLRLMASMVLLLPLSRRGSCLSCRGIMEQEQQLQVTACRLPYPLIR